MSDAYVGLAQKLGYAESERFRKLLGRLMDKEEVEVAASLPCSVADLAEQLGKKEEQVNKLLKGLFDKGVIFMTSKGYQFARDIFQLHDATACDVRLDKVWGRELLDLWEDFLQTEWYADWAKIVQTWDMPVWRVIPARKAISKETKLLPSEDVEAIIDEATKLALANCSCRRIAARCDSPADVCLQVNRGAEYAIKRGTGKELTKDEALKVLDSVKGGSTAMAIPEIVNKVLLVIKDPASLIKMLSSFGVKQLNAALIVGLLIVSLIFMSNFSHID